MRSVWKWMICMFAGHEWDAVLYKNLMLKHFQCKRCGKIEPF